MQVKRLMKFDSFLEKLCAVQRKALKSFSFEIEGFLENHRAVNYREIVEEVQDAGEKTDYGMSLISTFSILI